MAIESATGLRWRRELVVGRLLLRTGAKSIAMHIISEQFRFQIII